MEKRRASMASSATLIAMVVGCATTHDVKSEGVPRALKVPNTQVLSVAAHGVGVQIYECQATKDAPARFTWTLKAPEADLLYTSGKKFGKHYAGPTWEATDGSKVVGDVIGRDNGPDANAIPWLLLRAKSTSGNGVFSPTLSIQRLHTAGGKAPVGGCDASQSGKEARIHYTADYFFYAAKP
jgi:hypothetical protein